jgi:hypothetical protein
MVPLPIGDMGVVVNTTVSEPDIVSFIRIALALEFTVIAYTNGCKLLFVTEKLNISFPETLAVGIPVFSPKTAENGKA